LYFLKSIQNTGHVIFKLLWGKKVFVSFCFSELLENGTLQFDMNAVV